MAAPPPFSREFPAAATGDAPNPLIAATPNLLATTRAAKPQWQCEICNVPVGIANKDVHLAGKRHAREEQKRQSWDCTICDRSMTLAVKASHLAGKPHAAAVRELEGENQQAEDAGLVAVPEPTPEPANSIWTCEICNVSVEMAKKDEHLATNLHLAREKRQRWHCDVCDRFMPLGSKASHLAGRLHAAAVRAQQEPAAAAPTSRDGPNPSEPPIPALSTANLKWHCLICDVSVERAKKDEHLAGRPHARQKRQPWDCTICDRSMTLGVKASHLAGKAHAAAARKGGNSRRKAHAAAARKGGNSRRRDDDDYDYEEGRQLLMDIDTQWGLIPGGGAYNDL
jgi:rubrerythrin